MQQWARLGFNYSISPDVTFFLQAQHSKNWGVNGENGTGTDANGTNGTIYARQAFMLVRNFLVPNLTVKAGRQLVVWGNHRMFGHFDWNNVGWTHDGITTNYKLGKSANLQLGWLRTAERNCKNATSGNCIGPTQNTPASATDDANLLYVRAPMKVAGVVLEPTYIWHNGGTGRPWSNDNPNTFNDPRPQNQSRHTVGGRAVKKANLGGARLDVTVEGYYQFGEITLRGKDIPATAGTPAIPATTEVKVTGTPGNAIIRDYLVRRPGSTTTLLSREANINMGGGGGQAPDPYCTKNDPSALKKAYITGDGTGVIIPPSDNCAFGWRYAKGTFAKETVTTPGTPATPGTRAMPGPERTADIASYAFHIDAGLTLPVPMQPRLGLEYNTASGNTANAMNNEDFGGFDQLYPTNHIHFGYMDRMSWKNMNHYAASLQLRPTKASHFEVTGHLFALNEATDSWYHAGQAALGFANDNGANSKDIGSEIDVVYTHFFTPGNHVAWQIGGGVFLPGDRLNQAAGTGMDASEQTWGYTQLWVNF